MTKLMTGIFNAKNDISKPANEINKDHMNPNSNKKVKPDSPAKDEQWRFIDEGGNSQPLNGGEDKNKL